MGGCHWLGASVFLSDFCSLVITAKVESRFVGCRRSAMGSAPRRPIRGLRESSCPPPPWTPIKQIGDTGTRSDKTIICIICKQKTMVDGIHSNPPIRGLSTLSTSLTSWHKIIQKYHMQAEENANKQGYMVTYSQRGRDARAGSFSILYIL